MIKKNKIHIAEAYDDYLHLSDEQQCEILNQVCKVNKNQKVVDARIYFAKAMYPSYKIIKGKKNEGSKDSTRVDRLSNSISKKPYTVTQCSTRSKE